MSAVLRLLFVVFLWCLAEGTRAELIFSAPPRESSAAGSELYGPLVTHLSELLGEKVSYSYPDNWLKYQRDLRKGRYDIVFDGPHFVSWRMAHLDHEVLVKLPGTLEFILVVNDTDQEITGAGDLIGKKICTIPPPNLATLTVISLFKNPVRQPEILGIRGDNKQVHEQFVAGQCRAAVFRKSFYDKALSAAQKSQLRILYQSKPLPNQALSVSGKINPEKRKEIIRSMTLGSGRKVSQSIAKRFGEDSTKSFVAASPKEYADHSSLLEGVVFGW